MIEEFKQPLFKPQDFNFRNLNDEILDCFHVLMLKLSFTRDMAKYLDFTLCRGGVLSPQDLVSQDKIFQKPSLRPKMDAFQPIKHYHPLSIWLSCCNLYDHGRAHIAKWLHLKLLNIWHLKRIRMSPRGGVNRRLKLFLEWLNKGGIKL